jgi:site-specific DNA recombinase
MASSDLTSVATRPVRCAIYTRKSTEEGLAQEFNSLDAQRDCAEAYIQSQRQQGWMALPQHYDDGGFTGANLERPGLQRLLADIEAGRIDCVVIYKVDRLSRSLFDFARLMNIFEKHSVSFVSVTQQLNSNTPMGRLTLNILLSFAQFEREMVAERTRDKTSAARKKGKWTGGYPVLGYDSDPSRSRLAVNEGEAEQVRGIFNLFLQHQSLMATLDEIQRRGWRLKSWTTNQGQRHQGGPFDRPALIRLLRNVLYRGDIGHKGKIYRGEQPAIVERKIWRKVNDLLASRRRGHRPARGHAQSGVFSELVECANCGRALVCGYTSKKGRRYPYYVCLMVQKRGAQACRGQCVSARRLEEAVVDALYRIAAESDGTLRRTLPLDRMVWRDLNEPEKRQILKTAVERIICDRRKRQVTIRLKPAVTADSRGSTVTVRLTNSAAVDRTAPPQPKTLIAETTEKGRPRITQLLALAVRLEQLLANGTAKDYADLARLGGVSRARITQILNLRNLAPAIQEQILFLNGNGREKDLTERAVRRVSGTLDWRRQAKLFTKLRTNGV